MTIAASDEDVEAGFRKIVEWAEKQVVVLYNLCLINWSSHYAKNY